MIPFIIISENEWIERFQPQLNQICEDPVIDFGDGGASFETYGEELAYIKRVDPAQIWTLFDDDLTVRSGYHVLNRLNYFVCKVPVPAGLSYELYLTDD